MNEFVTLTQAKAAKIRLEAECIKFLRESISNFQQDMGIGITSIDLHLKDITDKYGHTIKLLYDVRITVEL